MTLPCSVHLAGLDNFFPSGQQSNTATALIGSVCLGDRRDGNNSSAQGHDALQQTADVVGQAPTMANRGPLSAEPVC